MPSCLQNNKAPLKNSAPCSCPPSTLAYPIEFTILCYSMPPQSTKHATLELPCIQLQPGHPSFMGENFPPPVALPLYPSSLYPPSTSKNPTCCVFGLFCCLKISDLIHREPFWPLALQHIWHFLVASKYPLLEWGTGLGHFQQRTFMTSWIWIRFRIRTLSISTPSFKIYVLSQVYDEYL